MGRHAFLDPFVPSLSLDELGMLGDSDDPELVEGQARGERYVVMRLPSFPGRSHCVRQQA